MSAVKNAAHTADRVYDVRASRPGVPVAPFWPPIIVTPASSDYGLFICFAGLVCDEGPIARLRDCSTRILPLLDPVFATEHAATPSGEGGHVAVDKRVSGLFLRPTPS